MRDCLGNELTPGDFVMLHSYGGFYPGVFVRMKGRSYHVQTTYSSTPEYAIQRTEDNRRRIEEARMGQNVRLGHVSYTPNIRRILKMEPDSFPEHVRELLETEKELCYITRKIR